MTTTATNPQKQPCKALHMTYQFKPAAGPSTSNIKQQGKTNINLSLKSAAMYISHKIPQIHPIHVYYGKTHYNPKRTKAYTKGTWSKPKTHFWTRKIGSNKSIIPPFPLPYQKTNQNPNGFHYKKVTHFLGKWVEHYNIKAEVWTISDNTNPKSSATQEHKH